MIRSRGVISSVSTKSPTILWSGTPAEWPDWLTLRFSGYASIYRNDLWVHTLVNKRAKALARLPLKVYRKGADNSRDAATGSAYADLLARPSSRLDPFYFWLWVCSTYDVFGEAIVAKRRDGGGRPVELMPMHPTRVFDEIVDGETRWSYTGDDGRRVPMRRRDFVHFRSFDPDHPRRGMSPLEPLRSTIENEAGARTANSAMWRNGGRPSVILEHPGALSDKAMGHLATSWSDAHAGVDNWAKAAILEEGMTARILPLNVEELQYTDARRLNREEACALYDVPPPVVHILDRATFSNITEQMRSMYRDTMAPVLNLVESTLEFELRDGRFGATGDPDFGEDEYAEFLIDEVLRGGFEQRMTAYQQADFMTVAEKRAKENLPFIEGTDRIFLNAAQLPLSETGQLEQPAPSTGEMRSIVARIARSATVGDIDVEHATRGLSPPAVCVLVDAISTLPPTASTAELRDLMRGAPAL